MKMKRPTKTFLGAGLLFIVGTSDLSLSKSAVSKSNALLFQSREAVMVTFGAKLDSGSDLTPLRSEIEVLATDLVGAQISVTNQSRTIFTNGRIELLVPANLKFFCEKDVRNVVRTSLSSDHAELVKIIIPLIHSNQTLVTPYFIFLLNDTKTGTEITPEVTVMFEDINKAVIMKKAKLTIRVVSAR